VSIESIKARLAAATKGPFGDRQAARLEVMRWQEGGVAGKVAVRDGNGATGALGRA